MDLDKYEYRVRAEEINALIERKEYAEAVKVADTIDWRRVKSVMMLCKISDLYKMNRRYEDSKEILLLANERHPSSRKIVYSLCELAIKLEETVLAVEYYKEFVQIAPRDTGKYILQYRLYEAQDVSLEERIAVLEEYKKRDYREKWAYELAYLYHRIGLSTRCVEECDELILWFGEGKYVMKAMELKMLHESLTPLQQEKYDKRFQKEDEILPSEEHQVDENGLPIEIKAVEPSQGPTSKIPAKEILQELEGNIEIEEADADSSSEEEAIEPTDEDEIEIKVKTIDVHNEYNTINLQEELAKNLALLMAEEDMEATDATMAMPFATLSEAASSDTIMGAIIDDSIKNAIMAPLLQDTAELVPITEQDLIESMEEKMHVEDSGQTEENKTEAFLQQEEGAEKDSKERNNVETKDEDELFSYIEETEAVTEEEEIIDLEEQIYAALEEDIESEVPNGKTKELKVIGHQTEEEITVPQDVSKAIMAVMEQMEAKQAEALSAIKAAAEEAVAEAAKSAVANAVTIVENIAVELPTEDSIVKEKTSKVEEFSVEALDSDSNQDEKTNEQITGQLSLTDIMAEWEQTKKANEQKHIEEMRARVKQQTGPLFNDFDAMARASVAADLDLISPAEDVFAMTEPVEEKIELTTNSNDDMLIAAELGLEEELEEFTVEESGIEAEEAVDLSEKMIQEEQEEPKKPAKVLNTEEILGLEEKLLDALVLPDQDDKMHVSIAEPIKLKDTDYIQALAPEQKAQIEIETESEPQPEEAENLYEEGPKDEYEGLTPEEIAVKKLMDREAKKKEEKKKEDSIVNNPEEELQQIQSELSVTDSEDSEDLEGRGLTKQEKEAFASFAPTKESQRRVAKALDMMSIRAESGNMIISGENGTGLELLAQNILVELKEKYPDFSGKVAKISGEAFSEKDIGATLDSLKNGALIIEKAGNLSLDALGNLLYHIDRIKDQPLFIIMKDTEQEMERLKLTYPDIVNKFNASISVEALDNDGLINYAKEYAKENEYSIDEMGVLALYTKISDMQTIDHAVTVAEVREMIDMAISNAEKKNVSYFMDIILAKRYDSEDMVVLREKDFMN